MDQATHNKIVSFICGIADDVLRDLFKRGKYPGVILPMCVLRRLDAVLEELLDKAGITEQRAALCAAADFSRVRPELENLLSEWGSGDEAEEEGDDVPAKKGLPEKKKKKLLHAKTWERDAKLVEAANALRTDLGDGLFEDHNVFRERVDAAMEARGLKLSGADRKLILRAMSWRVETAPPVFAKIHKPGKVQPDPLRGVYEANIGGRKCTVEYEPDTELRDTEQVPLLEPGGVEAFLKREVLPYTPDAWLDESKTQIGYETSFTRHFYKPQPLRTLDEIRADILALEKETEGLLSEIVSGGVQ